MPRTIHAVLAGINEYRSPVPLLGGCLHDVNKWVEYLKSESSSFDLKVTLLQNKEATKEALTSSLENALTQASPTDVVFFFYSGHGTRETADPVFAEYIQDNALESLVCYDSIVDQKGTIEYNLLSDKELHYILSQYGKEGTHIILVFDCCHSGGITRNGFPNTDESVRERRYVPKERVAFVAPGRSWDQFLFAKQIPREEVEKKGWSALVVQKPHITLSACQNDESAFEQSGSGVFTSNLLEVLRRSKGSISYYDLQSRTRLFVQNQFRQTPAVYTIRKHEDDLLRMFLDKTTPASSLGCTMYYKVNTGWVIDLGAIHGITSYSSPVEIQWKEKNHAFPIQEVFSNYTVLKIPKDVEASLVREQAYPASVKNYFSGDTAFFIDINEKDISTPIVSLAEKWIHEHRSPFSLTNTLTQSTYIIRKTKDILFICQNDDQQRPATEVSTPNSDIAARTIQCMRHIAQWEYVRSLCNPEFNSKEFPVEMTFYRVQPDLTRQELIARGDTFEFDYDQSSNGAWTGKLKVSITNQSKVKYYCAVLYLSNLFQVYGNMLDGKIIGLNAGQTAWVYNGNDIELDLEPHIIDFNYEYSIFYLKLLACVNSFQVETLEQSALPAPGLKQQKGVDDVTHRGIKTRTEQAEYNIEWFTRTVCFKGRNPNYSVR